MDLFRVALKLIILGSTLILIYTGCQNSESKFSNTTINSQAKHRTDSVMNSWKMEKLAQEKNREEKMKFDSTMRQRLKRNETDPYFLLFWDGMTDNEFNWVKDSLNRSGVLDSGRLGLLIDNQIIYLNLKATSIKAEWCFSNSPINSRDSVQGVSLIQDDFEIQSEYVYEKETGTRYLPKNDVVKRTVKSLNKTYKNLELFFAQKYPTRYNKYLCKHKNEWGDSRKYPDDEFETIYYFESEKSCIIREAVQYPSLNIWQALQGVKPVFIEGTSYYLFKIQYFPRSKFNNWAQKVFEEKREKLKNKNQEKEKAHKNNSAV